ncbi:hypothetical protein K2173_003205 [Erythroxylum novogranatense]|uniref:CCHC-type domain-containing protein n=1 Tax=Erythroxylum novogranatense TaxID=1862640 RepID=A0AAV8SWX8_9ROSI|nr:hypothetical protein K2173_003205 [Erythroxylum novogranatense]
MASPWPDEEPVEVEEGDIIHLTGEAAGDITLSQNLHTKLDKQWGQTVVVKVFGRRIGFRTINDRLQALWNPRGAMKFVDLEHDFFIVKFMEEAVFCIGGPEVDKGVPPSHGQLTQVVVWIRFPGLPIARYHSRILAALGNLVGTLAKIDEATLLLHRGKYARLAVEVHLRKPMRSTVELDDEQLCVAYEGLSMLCLNCGMVSHVKNACPQRPPVTTITAPPSACAVGETTGQPKAGASTTGDIPTSPSNGYGPWTVVQPYPQRLPRQTQVGRQTVSSSKGGSRFTLMLV